MSEIKGTNEWMRKIPRLVIGAPQGQSGKTTLTIGLLRALHRQGMVIQPFKKGPDYIDPSWHTAAAGTVCRNLDSFLMTRQDICRSVAQNTQDEEIAIIEGAMGLYDGLDLAGSSSTAEIAKITGSPVILVIDATRMTRSIAAIVMGFQHFDPQVRIAGVILNKVARPRHERIAREAIEQFCHIPVLGAIPKDAGLAIPDRHLGLVTQGELGESELLIERLADLISKHVDLPKIIELAQTAPELPDLGSMPEQATNSLIIKPKIAGPKIAVLMDQAFSFYYPENFEALTALGAELVFVNSLNDPQLPPGTEALYIGGGFPEIFAAELERNRGLKNEIRYAGEQGLPIYAECGGLMYLGRSIQIQEQIYGMVGLLPLDTRMEGKPQGHGYTIMKPCSGNPWFRDSQEIKGHEFHNSRVINMDQNLEYAFELKKGSGLDGHYDGIFYKRVLASYTHLHTSSSPEWARSFVQLALSYREEQWAKRIRAAGE